MLAKDGLKVGMRPVFTFLPGETPLLVSIPHAGIEVPATIRSRLTESARTLRDTDWFVNRLYHWVTDLGAGLLIANYSRYVIDLNRPPDNAALYQNFGTGLLPRQSFDGKPIYRKGMQPGPSESQQRLRDYWQPYHDQIQIELAALKKRHGHAVLFDAHSILSKVPRLFVGRLAELNLGSFAGASADASLITAAMTILQSKSDYSAVLDGRFRGGYITRHYGQPMEGVHALQLEMAQSVYMRETPPAFEEVLEAKIEPLLRELMDMLLRWQP